MEEVWKDVVGYEGYYQVSNLGRCRSLDRCINHPISKNGKKMLNGRILSLCKCGSGYLMASFSLDGKRKFEMVHRIVAKAFLPNPDNLPEINHIDEDKTNNCVDNLEWCTSKYNANYGARNAKAGEKHRKAVVQKDLQGNIIKKWSNLTEACMSCGADASSVGRVCRGKQRTARGFIWEYA